MDIETIYRLYFRDVFLFLQGLTGSETLAEELTQETFFKALDGLKGFDGRQDVRAWLFTVARNAYYDHCRKAKRTAPLDDAADAAAGDRGDGRDDGEHTGHGNDRDAGNRSDRNRGIA